MSAPGRPTDALTDWVRIRPQISWPCWSGAHLSHGASHRDAFRDFFNATRGSRDTEGTTRVLEALDLALADAKRGDRLTFTLMADWQQTMLGEGVAAFRTMPAFSKGGRERYGIATGTQARFEQCLSESTQRDLPLPSHAARTYLDILFFHPFEDGNARAAMLALAFVLAREGAAIDQVHPLQTTRWADDAEGAADLAVLLGILINAAQRRPSHGRQS
ncbi:Fic family protein [Streptomyces sp. LMG1-1-1.1]